VSKSLKFLVLFLGVFAVTYFYFSSHKKSNKVGKNNVLINKNPLEKNERGIASSSQKSKHASRKKDTILVKLKDNASESQVQDLKSLFNKFDLRLDKKILNGKVSRLKVSNKSFEDQEEVISEQLMQTGAVEYSEPDYLVPPSLIPNDSYYNMQWHHKTINSETAWNYSQGNTNVLVAICDSGFDLFHPDLADRFSLPGYNTVHDDTVISDVNDHGTMTSGVLAAAANNAQGVAGMSWQNKLLPIQISDQADGVSTYSDIAECITYAKDHSAKVVNISYDYMYTSSTINDAALILRNAGGLVVVAAGNSAADISAWGSSPNMIVVGATDSSDAMAWFSNFGTPVDFFAPGQDIYTTAANNNYYSMSGTSFSAPVTAGTAALIYSLNPSWTANQVENFLVSSLTTVGNIKRLNAGAALQMASQSLAPPVITLDNLAPGASDVNHSYTGKWCTSAQAGYYGLKSLYNCGPKLDTYRFKPSIPTARSYAVYIRYLARSTLSTKASVKVYSTSGLVTKPVNMQTGGGTWVLLGTFNLRAGTTNYVEVSDAAGTVDIDAVKFEAQ
jgi:subtilisin family serine protease